MKFSNILSRLSRNHLVERIRYNSTSSTSSRATPSFITTPIFYVNGTPHLGHAYTAVLADALHRWHLLKGASTSTSVFATGTDEHGAKVARAAERLGMPPQDFCDAVSLEFRGLFDRLGVEYTDFVRTTESRHEMAVKQFWNSLVEKGFIYEGTYAGWYSIVEEAFLPANHENMVEECRETPGKFICTETGDVVEWIEEQNYLFRLTEFAEKLRKWLTENEVIKPSVFLPSVLSSLDNLSTDLSVSRSRSRLSWGLAVPGDDSQTVYVWLDALINYLTVAGYPFSHRGVWNNAIHVIGKDILKFHALYWPAFLMAAELPLPRHIFVHSHWLVDGRKMSKSLGNVVDPRLFVDKLSADSLRYFLLAEATPQDDNNFSEKRVIEKLNAELCNTLGNLLNRVVGKNLNPDQIFPIPSVAAYNHFLLRREGPSHHHLHSLIASIESLPRRFDEEFEILRIDRAVEAVMSILREANQFLQHARPWKMDQSLEAEEIRVVLYVVLETLRVSGILLQPIVPGLATKMLDVIGVDVNGRSLFRLAGDRRPFYRISASSTSRLSTDSVTNVALDCANIPLYPRIQI